MEEQSGTVWQSQTSEASEPPASEPLEPVRVDTDEIEGGAAAPEAEPPGEPAAPGEARVAGAPGEPAAPDAPRRTGGPGRRRRRRSLLVVGSVVLVAAAIAFPLTLSGGQDAGAAVLDAVSSAINQRSADMTLSGTVTADGVTAVLTGSGRVDFSTGAATVTDAATVRGGRVTTETICIGSTIYEKVPGLSQLVPGKTWVSLDMSSAPSGGAGSPATTQVLGTTSDPAAVLEVLQRSGGTVQALGGSTRSGVAVQEYEVVLDHTELESNIARAHLPAWLRTATSDLDLDTATFTVYVEGTGVLQSVGVKMAMSVDRTSVTTDYTTTFSTYGAPVAIDAPPSTEIVTGQQLSEAAGAGTTPT